tara:strand:+ start:602 stop:817 length:216 start_codon:yes stop_codon:yes gene_type:complete
MVMTKLYMTNKKNKDINVEDTALEYFTHIGERAVVYNKKINKEIEGLDKFNKEQKKIIKEFFIHILKELDK